MLSYLTDHTTDNGHSRQGVNVYELISAINIRLYLIQDAHAIVVLLSRLCTLCNSELGPMRLISVLPYLWLGPSTRFGSRGCSGSYNDNAVPISCYDMFPYM